MNDSRICVSSLNVLCSFDTDPFQFLKEMEEGGGSAVAMEVSTQASADDGCMDTADSTV